jgi:DNA-binding CsgD family transcriptional regulator
MKRPYKGFDALTPTEVSVLEQLASGMSVNEIAKARHIAVTTTRSHVKSIMYKLDAHSQLQAVVAYYQRELAKAHQNGVKWNGDTTLPLFTKDYLALRYPDLVE